VTTTPHYIAGGGKSGGQAALDECGDEAANIVTRLQP
jgi:hypothetical protein